MNNFGSGVVCVRSAGPIHTPSGSRRQTVYGGVALDAQSCFMAAKKANSRPFIMCRTSRGAASSR